MGRVVLALGSSHSPQLSTPADLWLSHGEGDRRNPGLIDSTGTHRTYQELLEMAPATISQEIASDRIERRHEANQSAINRLSKTYADASLDVLVIIGDDQAEMHLDDNRPAIMVYRGDEFVNGQAHFTPDTPPARRASAWGWFEPDGDRAYPVASDLGLHIIEHLRDQEFDIAHSNRMPEHRPTMGHAYSYTYRRIMQDNIIPTVPVMVNTYYPPNQPTPNRCYQLGRQIRAAVESWSEDTRVGIIASGGLSHFVIDEELDGVVMKALRDGDSETLVNLPRERLNSGTSEIRNWIVMADAAEGLDHQWSDYVPGYRTPAGTGCAMGFGVWS